MTPTHSKDIEEFRRIYTDKNEIKPIVTASDIEAFITSKIIEAEKRGAEAERNAVRKSLMKAVQPKRYVKGENVIARANKSAWNSCRQSILKTLRTITNPN